MVHCNILSMNNKVIGYQSVIAFDEDFTILPEGLDDFFNLSLNEPWN